MFRYQYLVYSRNEGGSPEEILLGDKPILVTVVLWMFTSIAVLYFTR